MLWVRSLLFNILFYATTALLCVVLLPTLIMPMPAIHAGFRAWAHFTGFYLRLCLGITHRFEGSLPPPGQPMIIAGKHQSAWETIMLALVLDRPAFILKRELSWIPLLGWYMMKLEMIPINRTSGSSAIRRMLAAAKKAKADGRHIVIFPEGTRVAVGQTRRYQSGTAALYKHLDLPVAPFALNSGLCWGRKAFIKRPGCITVRFLPPIEAGLKKADFLARLERDIETQTQVLLAESQTGKPA